jgi:hypothetical protein
MDAGLVKEKALHVAKVWLNSVRIQAEAVPVSHDEACIEEPAQHARFNQPLCLAVPGLEPPVLMDDEADAGLAARLDHPDALLPFGGHGLLANHMTTAGRGLESQGGVRVGTSDDVHKVGLLRLDHPL